MLAFFVLQTTSFSQTTIANEKCVRVSGYHRSSFDLVLIEELGHSFQGVLTNNQQPHHSLEESKHRLCYFVVF